MSTFLFNDDWKLNVARAKQRNAFHVHKFGRNNALTNGTEETIWDGSNVYPWAVWDLGADYIFIKSLVSSDTGKKVTIEGLDANLNLQSEEVTLDATNASTAVTTANTYLRVHRMFNSGDTTMTGGVTALYGDGITGVMVAAFEPGAEQSLMAVYTVPAGHTAYCTQFDFSGSANSALKSSLYVCKQNGVFRIVHSGSTYGGQYNYGFDIPLEIAAGSDIDLRATASSGSASVSGSFNLVVIKDNETSEWSTGY